MTSHALLLLLLLALGCAREVTVSFDASPPDASPPDASPPDASPPDVPAPDVAIACAVPGVLACVSPRARSLCGSDLVVTVRDCPDRPSATGFCDNGACRITCAAGAFDCDDDAANGCESRVACPDVMLTGFGGSTGYGPDAQCLHPSDNGAYAGPGAHDGDAPVPIDLAPAFPEGLSFFGQHLHAMYVNVNGAVSFGRALETATPVAFPVAGQPMIAPWWGDVDTRGGGQPARNSVCFALQPHRLVVTWLRVGHFDRRDERANSFQLVVRTDPERCPADDPTFEFRYARCEWTVGNEAVGVPAQAGLDAGNLRNYIALPQSRTAAIADLCRTTNVPGGPPGLYRFEVRSSGCMGNI